LPVNLEDIRLCNNIKNGTGNSLAVRAADLHAANLPAASKPSNSRPIYKPIRSVERAFAILSELNKLSDASVEELAKAAALPWPTTLRMLETLDRLGYVTRGVGRTRFRPAIGVRTLSDGFRDETWVSQIAASGLARLTKQTGWPATFSTLAGCEMVIREATHNQTALAVEYGMLGRRIPLLISSGGRAYLSFTSKVEREQLLSILRERGGEDARNANSETLSRSLRQIRRLGYAQRVRGAMPLTSSMAVPVRIGGRVIGCITIIWIASAFSMREAVDRYLKSLQALAESFEGELKAGIY
jgi:IclR family mhp operon transcriptional activator